MTDFEGVIRKVESGCPAIEGSRVVTNLCYYSEASPTTLGAPEGTSPPTITFANIGGTAVEAIAFPGGVSSFAASRRTGSAPGKSGYFLRQISARVVHSFYVAFSRKLTGTESIRIYITGSEGGPHTTFNSSKSPVKTHRAFLFF